MRIFLAFMTEMGARFTVDSQRADRFHQADSRGGLPVDLISPLQGITWRFTQFASGCDCQSGVWERISFNVSGPFTTTSSGVRSIPLGVHRACYLARSSISHYSDAGGCELDLLGSSWNLISRSDSAVSGTTTCEAFCID